MTSSDTPTRRNVPWVVLTLLLALQGCDTATPAEHLSRARDYYADQEINAAVIELKNALQKDPDLAEARLLLGSLYLEQGDATAALKELERAQDLGLDEARVIPPLLTAKLVVGRYQEVIGQLETMPELAPELAVIQGNALLQARDLERARNAFEQAHAAAPERGDAVLGLARVAWSSGRLERAGELMAQAVELSPGDPGAWLAKAELHVQLRELDEALAAYESMSGLPGSAVEAQLGIARVRLVQGELEAAATALEGVLARSPTYPPANYLKGLLAFQQQDFDAAESALLVVQQSAPNHVPSLFLMGAVKYHQEQFAQARDLLERYLAHDQRNVPARKLLAAMSLKDGDADSAVDALAPVAADLDDPQGLALLGTAYLRQGDLAEATEYLGRAADLAPDIAALRTQLALGLLAAGEKDNAVAELEAAVELDDELIQSEVLLVLVHLRAGEFAEALAGAEAMVAARPDDPVGHNLKGAALLGLGRAQDGEAALEVALAVDPTFTPAATNLVRIAVQRGDTDAAQALYEDLLSADPGNLQARMGLAEMAVAAGDRDAALAHLEAARLDHAEAFAPRLVLARLAVLAGDLEGADRYIEEAATIAPGRIDVLLLAASIDVDTGALESARRRVDALHAQLQNGGAAGAVYLSLATMQQRLGQADRARRSLEQALSLEPDNAGARAGLARLDIAAGELARARTAVDALAAADWNPPTLSLVQGDLAMAEDRTAEAIASYRVAATGGVREGALKLVNALAAGGDVDRAAEAAHAWLADHPKDDAMRMVLANAMLQSDDKSGAIGVYEDLDTRSDNPVVLNNLAWLYMERGDPRAVETARLAYELAPESAEISDTLGWLLVRDGQIDEGLMHLRRAADGLPENGSVLYHLGVAHMQAGDSDAARASLEAALESGEFPERTEAELALAELEV